MTPRWILLIWPDTEWYAVRSIGIWNHRWSCSLPITCQTRFNSQESFGTGPSSGDGRKVVQQLQQQCPQTSLLHVIGHSKSNHHQRMHTKNCKGESSVHATIVGEFIPQPLADLRMQYATRKAALLRFAIAKDQSRTKSHRQFIKYVAVDNNCVSDTSESYQLFILQETCSKPLVVTVKLNN